MRNESFVCERCGREVWLHPESSARNHCPYCLVSKHLDRDFPGDRLAECGGLMSPVDIDHRKNKGYMILHRCDRCGKEILNKVAPDDEFLTFIKKLNKSRW